MYWTHADDVRLCSWLIDFVREVLLPDSKIRIDKDDVQFDGGLRVHRRSGVWCHHGRGINGASPIPLIMAIRACSFEDATALGNAWNISHPGLGPCQHILTDDNSDDDLGATVLAVRRHLTDVCLAALLTLTPPDPEGQYLIGRGIHFPLPDSIKRLPANVLRWGEGGVASLLYQDGTLAGCQVTFVDPSGNKSMIEPVRCTYRLDRKLRGATFGLMPTMAEMLAMAKWDQKLRIAEGTEDWLSVRQTFPGERAVGLPGIGALHHLTVAKGLSAVIGRDGDEPGSSADLGLIAGRDALLLQGAVVSCTTPELGEDNNSTLVRDGESGLRALFDTAVPVELSKDGEIERASHMNIVEYESKRRELADKLEMRVGVLDVLVRTAQLQRVRQRGEIPENKQPHWPGIIDPDAAADALLALLRKHLRVDENKLVVMTIWVAHAHLVCAPNVNMPRSPRLHINSPLPGSGKTTSHRMLRLVCPRAESMSSTTASATFRMLGGPELPTLLVDEADIQLGAAENDLLAVLNCGDTRDTAVIRRSVKTDDGNYVSQEFPAFSPAVLLGLFDLAPTLEERSIRIVFRRVLGGNRPARLKKESREELAEIGRHLQAWAATEPEWQEPDDELEWLGKQTARTADNWTILYHTAERLGGNWAERLKAAALAELGTERQLHPSERLLDDIFRIMNSLKKPDYNARRSTWPADCYERIRSSTLIEKLLADPYSEWHRCNRGGRIDYEWLSRRLIALLSPDGLSQHWRAAGGTHRGYLRSQFQRIWDECGISEPTADGDDDTHSSQRTRNTPGTPGTNHTESAADRENSASSTAGNDSVPGVPGSEGAHREDGIVGEGNGENPQPLDLESLDAEAIIAELIRRNPGLSDSTIGKKAFRSSTEVKAVRASLKEKEKKGKKQQGPSPESEP
jgi:hypothetical protein